MPGARPDADPTAVAAATFAAPADVVWRYRLDFTNLPEYNPDVSDLARVRDGDPNGAGGVCGPGARYAFRLADARRAGVSQPVELWLIEVTEPSLVSAGMKGDSEAYEEFVVEPRDDGGCHATLTLWVSLPEGLPDDVRAAAAAGSLEQIAKEMRLMKTALDGQAG
jgi:hypothetical protein